MASQDEVGKKIKTNKEANDFEMGTCTSGRELLRRKSFLTLGNPRMGGEKGSSGTSEENTATGAQKAKWR